jgi:hypothetical protein
MDVSRSVLDWRLRSGGGSMRLKTEFFKNGDNMAIRTNAKTEDEFISSAAAVLSDLIEERRYEHDWEFQFERWLVQVSDIVCKLRGYKSDVDEQRVITAGDVAPSEADRVAVFGERLESPVSDGAVDPVVSSSHGPSTREKA